MRIVFWHPQERVDVPDMVAANFLVLGEFRRTIRETLLGAEENRILRGFAVEASAVPDALITVKLDDAGTLSTAIGSESVGSHINFGQLMGGQDDNANLEGNAQQTLDFSAQPWPATYTVQMRFVYSEGVADNRAYWDTVTDSEFISSDNTRYLSGFELRLSGGASNEWIDLASVVWDGASIDSADITDLRVFAMEGKAPYRATTQIGLNSGSILPDFNRGTNRGGSAIGLNAVWPVLRALGRQVADIKGQSEAGYFSWWERVFGPVDALDALADDQTRSLQTVDTVMFTVGDGTDTFGDFNGATGLEDCLQHIEDMGANTPSSIQIVCKARDTAAPAPFTWPVTTAHAINAACSRLEIDFQGHRMTYTGPVATSAISMSGDLEVRNLRMNAVPSNNATIFQVGVTNRVRLINCTVYGDASASAAAAVIGGAGSYFEQSSVFGGVRFLSGGTPSGTDDDYNATCVVEGGTYFWMELGTTPAAERITPLHVRNALFRAQADYGRDATLDLNNNRYCKVENCTFDYVAVAHAIEIAEANGILPTGNKIRDCHFTHSAAAVAFTNHYAIRLYQADETVISGCDFVLDDADGGGVILVNTDRALIEGCFFDGQSTAGRADIDSAIVFDAAGAICYYNTIKNCRFRDWDPNTTNSRTILNAVSTPGIVGLIVEGCHFEDCGGYCVNMYSAGATVGAVTIANCQVDVNVAAGQGFTVENSVNPVVTGNTLLFTTGATSGVNADGVTGGVASGNRMVNGVFSTTAGVLWGVAGGGGPSNLNYVT